MVPIIIKMEHNTEVDLLQAKNMEMEYFCFQMVPKLKAFGIIIIYKDQLKYFIIMEIIMKAIYICQKNQEKVFIVGITNKKIKFNIKDNLRKIIWKDQQ